MKEMQNTQLAKPLTFNLLKLVNGCILIKWQSARLLWWHGDTTLSMIHRTSNLDLMEAAAASSATLLGQNLVANTFSNDNIPLTNFI